jgi:hypothetical protein
MAVREVKGVHLGKLITVRGIVTRVSEVKPLDIPFTEHAHVVERAPFWLLLGRPFQQALLCRIEDLSSVDVDVSVRNPADPSRCITIPSRLRKVQVASVRILSFSCQSQPAQSQSRPQSQSPPSQSQPVSLSPSLSLSRPPPESHSLGSTASVQTYKKVAEKVRPVPASLSEEFRIIRHIPSEDAQLP